MEDLSIIFVFSKSDTVKTTAEYFVEAAKELKVPFEIINQSSSVNFSNQNLKILREGERNRNTIILYIEGGDHRFLPLDIFRSKSKKIGYLIDSHLKEDEHVALSSIFDKTYIAQKAYAKKVGADWLPLAAKKNEFLHLSKDIDISLVGSIDPKRHPQRFQLVEELKQEFQNSYFGSASAIQMEEIYARSKIVVNWSINRDLNMRIFEGLASNARVISNELNIDELADAGLLEQIDLVPNIRECRIRAREIVDNFVNYNRVNKPVSGHLYVDRLKTIIRASSSIEAIPVPDYKIAGALYAINNAEQLLRLYRSNDKFLQYGRKDALKHKLVSAFTSTVSRF